MAEAATTVLKGRLNGAQRTRLKSLLDMMYTPRELAEEIGFSHRQIYRVYIPLGCPHQRDENDHIWINGWEFRSWYESVYPKVTLKENEAYCMTCRRAVEIVDPEERRGSFFVYLVSDCPHCGRTLARITRNDRGDEA